MGMAATRRSSANINIDRILEGTFQRPRSVKPPTAMTRKPFILVFKEWASSQVAAYRVGLVLGYLSMMYFGGQVLYAGIPTFSFTTPQGWTLIWACVVILGGLIGGIGSLRAGEEPITKVVKIYNGIELAGSIMLFLTLGSYAAILLYIGYGYGDAGRQSAGSGFVALGVPHFIRLLWLVFRPRFLPGNRAHKIATGPVLLVPDGYKLVKIGEAPEATTDLKEI